MLGIILLLHLDLKCAQAMHTVVFSLIYLLPAHILSQDAKEE